MRKKKIERIGERWKTQEGYWVTIIRYVTCAYCTIQFENGYIIKNRSYNDIKNGNIKYPFHPSINGVGYIGIGPYKTSKKGDMVKSYNQWLKIITNGDVCVSWYNYQVFSEWFNNNYTLDYVLDNKLLSTGIDLYSPKTCCFIPSEIENMLYKNTLDNCVSYIKKNNKYRVRLKTEMGIIYLGYFDTHDEAKEIFKINKEIQIREMGIKHKSSITNECYQALINFNVVVD